MEYYADFTVITSALLQELPIRSFLLVSVSILILRLVQRLCPTIKDTHIHSVEESDAIVCDRVYKLAVERTVVHFYA